MVVVAIIGLLSAVAIPNFQKYQAKAKVSEAKLQLSAIYTAEVSFFSDFSIYAGCLKYMGYDPSNEVASRYYSTGFHTLGALDSTAALNAENSGLVTGATGCVLSSQNGQTHFIAGKRIVANIAPAPIAELDGTSTGTQASSALLTFKAGAAGFINKDNVSGTTSSFLTIDQNKTLLTVRPGY